MSSQPSYRNAAARICISGVTFNDLRGTFENRAWEPGCSEPECFAVTGRAFMSAGSANAYCARTDALPPAGITKIEARFENEGVNRSVKRARLIGDQSA